MLPGHTCVVLFDDLRVLQFFREATWEGGGSALTMRGLVADFAQKYVHGYVPSRACACAGERLLESQPILVGR